jgi:uncharacterized membrane protein
MKDNKTLRANRSTREIYGRSLNSSDFKEENNPMFYVGLLIFVAGVLGIIFL